jgi:Cu+-exporting ATPase
VAAEWAGRAVFLGSINALRTRKIDMSGADANLPGTVLGLAIGHTLAALVSLADPPKPHAMEVVRNLQDSGLNAYIVSGDNRAVVESIARGVGIPPENLFAEVRPEAKAQIIEGLQKKGERIAFIGDGINDAPALAQADLGIAVTRASDVAREAADILLLKADIEAIPDALGICQATLRTIKQNLFWAFFYNAAAIPLAAAGVLPPVACAAAMAISDLFVIGNSLRLLRYRGT